MFGIAAGHQRKVRSLAREAVMTRANKYEIEESIRAAIDDLDGRLAELRPGDSVTSSAAITVIRATGDAETYPAGTTLVVTSKGR